MSLEWQLVLADLSCLTVPIRFRHPHPLHLEKGCHATALLQALYSFESSPLGSRQSALAAIQEGELYKAIIGWTLVVTERLILPPRSTGLFGDQVTNHGVDGRSPELLALLTMENKLRATLESYAVHADWLPEDSYGVQDFGAPGAAALAETSVGQRQAFGCVAAERPLYFYNKPREFDARSVSSNCFFQERTMNKWWIAPQGDGPLQRDYYRLTDREQRDLWVFKTGADQWSVHGIYS